MIPSHPYHLATLQDWYKWRRCYDGGDDFLHHYLQKYSTRETDEDYNIRRSLTPVTTFAKSAINDVKNSIFQRMSSVSRRDGSSNYMKAVKGEGLGVDNRGSSMTAFLGKEVLDDLLVIGKVGVYIDAPAHVGGTLSVDSQFKPYIYAYGVEQIINWVKNDPEHPSEYQSLVLREEVETFDDTFGMPTGNKQRYRHVWLDPEDGFVRVQFYNSTHEQESDIIKLNIKRIPFVLFDIGKSLIEDVCSYQIALLNVWSSNVHFAVQSGFPIYVEQRDPRDVGNHLKKPAVGTPTTSTALGDGEREIVVGVAKGRSYDLGADKPGFINPSSEPLTANMKLCNTLKQDIRELINLAVINVGIQSSAESKGMDNQGLESGLSSIGLEMERGEREVAKHWAAYEGGKDIAIVKYPDRWSLKSDKEKIEDATALNEVVSKLPSREAKKVASEILADALLSSKISDERMTTILSEIKSANYTTSDPDTIQMAKEQGMLSAATGAAALGFDTKEADLAAEEHVERLAAIAAHQTQGVSGVADTQGNAGDDNRKAKEASRQTDNNPSTKVPVRGKGK